MKKGLNIVEVTCVAVTFVIFLFGVPITFAMNNVSSYKDQGMTYSSNASAQVIKVNTEPTIALYHEYANQVIDIELEEYVVGVVAAEMPVSFGEEALKAQAVAARTYALARTEAFGTNRCSSSNGEWEICSTVNCQAYKSEEEIRAWWGDEEYDENIEKIRKAVYDTAGEILVYDGELVAVPYYFSTSGGKTENAVDVFQTGAPYLVSVESPGEENAPSYQSQEVYTYSEFVNQVNSTRPDANLNSATLREDVKILGNTDGGGVSELLLGDITVAGTEFRTMMGLKSTEFEISYTDENIIIDVTGFGHGVGMSQWGAGMMAEQGRTYKEILMHYYTGIEIQSIY